MRCSALFIVNCAWFISFFFLPSALLYAQHVAPQNTNKVSPSDTIVPGKGKPELQIKKIKEEKVKHLSDSTGNEPKKSALVDTTIQNKYGDLLDDDITYNKRSAWWKPALGVTGINVFVLSMDRYVLKYDYSISVNRDSWNHNIKTGWAWDNDRFGINFSGHPYTGGLYFNTARANGYSYFESLPFAVGGSLMWEYFGENTLPSYSDVINTTVNGAFLGEILYRMSSNVLDDRTRGGERVFREIIAGIIDPVRGISRLLQGKTFRKTNKEVYQKEPLNITLFGGVHIINDQTNRPIGNETKNPIINIQLDYGNPFEQRKRKAFDFFKLRAEFSSGVGRKILDNVIGYGILFGKNAQHGKLAMLIGGFQYYDYWDSKSFELLTVGFGGGVFSKLPVSKTSNLYTNIHLAVIPFGAYSGQLGPDTSQFRDYSYDGGLEGKVESTLILDKYITASLVYYYYFMHTYPHVTTKDYGSTPDDLPQNNYIGILKPNISFHLYKGLSLGYEHYVYYDDRHRQNLPVIHTVRTEEKIFLLFYFEDAQRRGHYN
jgi:hypothetical protein